jgi:hypothetical protein
MALDRLRTDLIELRSSSTSYSNIFPRGVLLVTKSEALVGSNSSAGSETATRAMEYNGQPDVDESTASVEVIPNLLTVKCMACNANRFLPGASSASKAFVREKHKPWKNPVGDDDKEFELVVCSDRVLQKDYYKQFGNPESRQQHQREDLPVRSMGAVEETLAREITKLSVQSESSSEKNGYANKATPPISPLSFPSSTSDKDAAAASCEAYARLELLAARAAECLLVHRTDEASRRTTETRMGSALFPKSLVSMLPRSLQNSFVDRCSLKVATRHTLEAAGSSGAHLRPKDCVRRAAKASASSQ